MSRHFFLAVLAAAIVVTTSWAQKQEVTMHFDVVRAGKDKTKEASKVVAWLTPASGQVNFSAVASPPQRLVHFDRAGISYVFCNIHPEMSAVVVVVDTPYYGMSNASGNVDIADVPPGSYVLHVWSEESSAEQLHALTRRVTISDESHTLGNLRLMETPG